MKIFFILLVLFYVSENLDCVWTLDVDDVILLEDILKEGEDTSLYNEDLVNIEDDEDDYENQKRRVWRRAKRLARKRVPGNGGRRDFQEENEDLVALEDENEVKKRDGLWRIVLRHAGKIIRHATGRKDEKEIKKRGFWHKVLHVAGKAAKAATGKDSKYEAKEDEDDDEDLVAFEDEKVMKKRGWRRVLHIAGKAAKAATGKDNKYADKEDEDDDEDPVTSEDEKDNRKRGFWHKVLHVAGKAAKAATGKDSKYETKDDEDDDEDLVALEDEKVMKKRGWRRVLHIAGKAAKAATGKDNKYEAKEDEDDAVPEDEDLEALEDEKEVKKRFWHRKAYFTAVKIAQLATGKDSKSENRDVENGNEKRSILDKIKDLLTTNKHEEKYTGSLQENDDDIEFDDIDSDDIPKRRKRAWFSGIPLTRTTKSNYVKSGGK